MLGISWCWTIDSLGLGVKSSQCTTIVIVIVNPVNPRKIISWLSTGPDCFGNDGTLGRDQLDLHTRFRRHRTGGGEDNHDRTSLGDGLSWFRPARVDEFGGIIMLDCSSRATCRVRLSNAYFTIAGADLHCSGSRGGNCYILSEWNPIDPRAQCR